MAPVINIIPKGTSQKIDSDMIAFQNGDITRFKIQTEDIHTHPHPLP